MATEIPAEMADRVAAAIANAHRDDVPDWWHEITEPVRDEYRRMAYAVAPLLCQAGREAAAKAIEAEVRRRRADGRPSVHGRAIHYAAAARLARGEGGDRG